MNEIELEKKLRKLDPSKAFSEAMLLATENDPSAQYCVGRFYQTGFGVDQDISDAIDWLSKAARNRSHVSARYLGDCYSMGVWGELDHNTAFEWYKLAAELGDPSSAYTLASCYLEGQGTNVDNEEAIRWLEYSAKEGHHLAKLLLDAINSQE